mgnify:CR=1 FL=1
MPEELLAICRELGITEDKVNIILRTTEEGTDEKPVYKLLDEKGRILIPKEFRQMAELESGDIVKLSVSSGKIMASKVDIVEMGSQDPQAVEAYVNAAVKHMSPANRCTCGKDSEIRTAGGRYGLLRNKYRAFEIRDDQVSQTLVDGNLCSIAEFIRHCDEGSIITLHTMEGEPFLIGLSKMFVFCGDKAFLDRQLIPYLRSMGGECV